MHIAEQKVLEVANEGELHIIKSNCRTYKVKRVDQSVDYAATHIEKSIPFHILQSCTDLHK
jgi:hypothetical protein